MYNSFVTDKDVYEKLNIEAILACAFARNAKMMRFIDAVYNTDKDRFFAEYKKSSRAKSRFISGSRLQIRLNAQKALGIIMAAEEDDEIKANLLMAAEKSFKNVVSVLAPIRKSGASAPLGLVLLACKCDRDMTDDNLHDAIGLYFYFLREYGMTYLIEPNVLEALKIVFYKENAFLKPFQMSLDEFCKKAGIASSHLKTIMGKTFAECGGKSLSEIGGTEPRSMELHGYFQTLWDIGQLDDVPASMYENEKFTSSELKEIFQIMLLHVAREEIDIEQDMSKMFLTGLFIRSISKIYKEAVNMVEQYAGIIRNTPDHKDLVRSNNLLKAQIEEEKLLLGNKQHQLNALQIELDRSVHKSEELQEALNAYKERARILEELFNEKLNYSENIEDQKVIIERAKSLRIVVFGGHQKWQGQVKDSAPNYTCIEADNYSFDSKIIDKADAIVIKTDYMSHAQWYKIMERARKKNIKVIYCTENVQVMMLKIGTMVK